MEIWKDIPGYEGLYQVSNLGRIKSLERDFKDKLGRRWYRKESILKSNNLGGYLSVSLRKDGKTRYKSIHRLVALVFIPNPNMKLEVNHKNGLKDDNRLENLEWCDRSYNLKHAYDNNLKHRSGKLTINEIYVIKGLIKNTNMTDKEICVIFDVNKETIRLIRKNKIWRNING